MCSFPHEQHQLRLFQYTAIDEFFACGSWALTKNRAPIFRRIFLSKNVVWFKREGATAECMQTDNVSEFTNRFTA